MKTMQYCNISDSKTCICITAFELASIKDKNSARIQIRRFTRGRCQQNFLRLAAIRQCRLVGCRKSQHNNCELEILKYSIKEGVFT
eukprot:scaffold59_cov189-Chaetoceros_neogracile.AAC.6